MTYESPALFIVTDRKSWPLDDLGFTTVGGLSPNTSMYARRLTSVSYSNQDDAEMEFYETGGAVLIVGTPCIVGTVVLCARINSTWVILRRAFMASYKLPTGGNMFNLTEEDMTIRFPQKEDHYPYSVELITTGDNKSALDGFYPLIPRFNGKGERRSHHSFWRLTPSLIRKPGADMALTSSQVYNEEEEENEKTYTLTVTHPDITTTVYEGVNDNQLSKVSGDSSLPDDVWMFYKIEANTPFWFEFDQDCDLDGLYTLWPDYLEHGAGFYPYATDLEYAISKGYYHKLDGTRSTLDYHMEYESGVFTIDGGDFVYTCDAGDFIYENGAKIIFALSVDNTGCDLPATIEVKRAKTGYSRTVKKVDQ